ncbi:MAG: 2-phosphosulfolactate phosphatase [Chloroflexi bacterium]|nr:2-phosphosulfolactate phosphatase [Chloroflexota bacterium]
MHGAVDPEETSQTRYRCRLEWGRQGARLAALRRDVAVIVDTLRFSTAAIAAVEYGAILYPSTDPADAAALARRLRADGRDGGAPEWQRRLSPAAYGAIEPGTRVIVLSPNGATCCQLAREAPFVLVGALTNAAAVAEAVERLLGEGPLGVTVVACGERRGQPGDDGPLRLAIEDYLGAGGILSYLSLPRSPEAEVCEAAFRGVQDRLPDLLWNSVSGVELRDKGLGEDVRYAAALNTSRAVPVLQGDYLEAFRL